MEANVCKQILGGRGECFSCREKKMAKLILLQLIIAIWALSVTCEKSASEPRVASILWRKDRGFELKKDVLLSISGDTVAVGQFLNTINQTGWSTLEVKTNPNFPDKVQANAAGILEGFLTYEILHQYWQNTVDGYCQGKENICKKIIDFVHKNTKWVKKKATKHRNTSPYWHHVALFYEQYEGVVQGFESTAKKTGSSIPHGDIFWMNIFGDLEDLEPALAGDEPIKGRVLGSGSCSALIKLLPGNSDLYVAHDTWNSYQSMLRILKRYSFGYHWTGQSKTLVPGNTMTFSSYPGIIYSGDDFNVISSGLAVTETTIGNSNADLWSFVKSKGQVFEGIRATVANRLAKSGKQWSRIFSKRNSGTYNNQWMVVDYKRFKPGKPLASNLLWVLEQLPGHVHSEDLTSVLKAQTYWPSYNTPYFKDIFNMSGGPAQVKKHGDWFSYEKTPRALIFKRDQGTIKDIKSMIKMMRYNNFKVDPLSACDCKPPYSAENAISARNDLNPKNGTYPFGALGHRSHGGTDMKLTNAEMFNNMDFIAISGPTYDDLPPFQWSKVDFGQDTPHFGHPDLWKFDPIKTKWNLK